MPDGESRTEDRFGRNPEFETMRIKKPNGFYGFVPISVMGEVRGSANVAIDYTTTFFRAFRRYEIVRVSERHEAAGLGAATVDVKKVPSGIAPASGSTVLLSAFDLTAASDTDQEVDLTATLVDRFLDVGDSLSMESSGDISTAAGVTVAVLLKAV